MSDKQLKDLTADDVRSTCESLSARVKLSKEDSCEYMGLLAAAVLEKPCDTLREECVSTADDAAEGAEGADANCMPPTDQRAGCTATVAEYEVCLIAETQVIRSLTCASSLSTLDTAPPECEVISRKCPQLFPSSDGQGAEDP